MIGNYTVLVTGATGLVGKSVVQHLLAIGCQVRIISRNEITWKHPSIQVYKGDINKYSFLVAIMKGCDVVIHCAGETMKSDLMYEVNVLLTKNIFDASQECGIKTLLHVSSVGVIGKSKCKVVDESTLCNPMNLYEETKLLAEGILKKGLNEGRVIIVRPTNIFSVDVLRQWVNKPFKRNIKHILSGNENAHFVYVEDVASAITHLIDATCKCKVDTFIVSSDEESGNTYRNIIDMLSGIHKDTETYINLSVPIWLPYLMRQAIGRKANYGDIIYSSKKLQKTGFRNLFGIVSGVKDAAAQI